MPLLRGVFWIGVMIILAPHDLGLASASSRADQGAACTADLNSCIHRQESVDALRALFLSRAIEVKQDLAAR